MKAEASLTDVASAIEQALTNLGFNANVQKLDEHSFDISVTTENKVTVLLISGVVGLGRGC